ncbi:MAG: NADH-quinone oxidoreductase subunit C, partial [Pseudomonadota bacterium]
MSSRIESLREGLRAEFGDDLKLETSTAGGLTLEIEPEALIETCTRLRDAEALKFEMLIDLCGVDYLHYGHSEWQTESATDTGFSRGVEREPVIADYESSFAPRRFAVVVHLLSVTHNTRLRLRCYTGEINPPVVPSLVPIWSGANWFEREAFDLFGIVFEGHPDLRRLLTDYGFIGHPFRKDFPLSGSVEVRYDPELGRVAYQPVSIEPRTLVPKVIRD